MDKDIKTFSGFVLLILSAYFIDKALEHYIPLDFTGKYAWIAALILAFISYQLIR